MSKIKILAITAVFLAAFTIPAFARASDQAASNSETLLKRVEYTIKTNGAFLDAARKIISESKNETAVTFLRRALLFSEEGKVHYSGGDYKFALEDLLDSTRMASYAIIFAKSDDPSVHEAIIREELSMSAEKEHERKEEMIKKGTIEVETFIMTAERLMADNIIDSAALKVAEARKVLDSSNKYVAAGDYDAALDIINKAYTLATQGVREVKRAQGEAVTFPKTTFSTEREAYDYELKKNDRYMFFASQVLKERNKDAGKVLDEARGLREKAVKAADSNIKTATEHLRESTTLLIKTIKETVNTR